MKNVRPHHIISILAAGGIVFAALNFSNQTLFANLDQFVLVAEDKIHLAENVQVSSGDIASSKEISIAANNIINGNLFSDDIKIAENTQINGSASFNKLKLANNSQILGEQESPISLPIIKFPDIPDFETGTQKLKIEQNQTINPGNFSEIEVKENTTLTLNPGAYNLNKLELRENSRLLFSGKTIINIKDELKINEKVLIAPNASNVSPTDLELNFAGGKPITISQESFISAKLLVPKAKVNLGERTTFRGQILGEEINIGAASVLARELAGTKTSDPEKIIKNSDGSIFPTDQIIVNFTDPATLSDAVGVANLINGRIVGFIEIANAYQIEAESLNVEDLNNKVQAIKNLQNPLVEGVFKNYVLQLE